MKVDGRYIVNIGTRSRTVDNWLSKHLVNTVVPILGTSTIGTIPQLLLSRHANALYPFYSHDVTTGSTGPTDIPRLGMANYSYDSKDNHCVMWGSPTHEPSQYCEVRDEIVALPRWRARETI